MTNQLAFHETQFNVISRNNQIWLSSKEIAQALGYAKTNAITKIYNQNTDEFTDGMSQVIESTTSAISEVPKSGISGNLRVKVRIFSLRGAHLIAMFARTPVAKEFRRWVLDILDCEVGTSVNALVKPVASPSGRGSYSIVIDMENDLPVCSRPLMPGEIVMNPESIRGWLEMQGLVLFTREELRGMTLEKLLAL